MSDRMLVSTRKGLIALERGGGGWRVVSVEFPGVAVTAALGDPRDGTLYAALKHGHFGAKLHRSSDDGKTWTELPAKHSNRSTRPGSLRWSLANGDSSTG